MATGKIIEESGECGELGSQCTQGFQTVETNTHNPGPVKNMHPLAKLGPEASNLQPLIHLLL